MAMELIHVFVGISLCTFAIASNATISTSSSSLPPTDTPVASSLPSTDATAATNSSLPPSDTTINPTSLVETTSEGISSIPEDTTTSNIFTSTVTIRPSSTPRLTTEECLDVYPACDDFVGANFCRKVVHISWMKKNCARSCGFCGVTTKAPSTESETTTELPTTMKETTTQEPTESTGVPCYDKTTVCKEYKSRGYCWRDIYKDLMKERCALTCGFCSGVTGIPPTTTYIPDQDCMDEPYYQCQRYKDRGECITNKPYMYKVCRKTCNLCNECMDTSSAYVCDYYLRNGYCSYPRNQKECKKTCGICHSPTSTAPPTPTLTDAPPPMNVSCGISSVKHQKVIGGKDATAHAWPWQVALYYNGYFICGGSLVSPRWIVTAAHCVYGKSHYGFTVTLGAHDRTSKNGHEQSFRASNVIYHRDYNRPSSINNDIAMIKMEKPAQFNKYVQPVCLPTASQTPAVNDTCYITGWGKTKHPGSSAYVLQQSKLAVVDQNICHKLNFENNNIPVTDKMICGGYGPGNRKSGCHGDSGGPFVCQRPDGRFYLQGAVSWGSPRCHTDDAYTVFARVTEFRSWIDSYLHQ